MNSWQISKRSALIWHLVLMKVRRWDWICEFISPCSCNFPLHSQRISNIKKRTLAAWPRWKRRDWCELRPRQWRTNWRRRRRKTDLIPLRLRHFSIQNVSMADSNRVEFWTSGLSFQDCCIDCLEIPTEENIAYISSSTMRHLTNIVASNAIFMKIFWGRATAVALVVENMASMT